MERAIPLVDLDLFVKGNAAQRADFVKQLGDAFHYVGFVGVVNHGVPKKLVDEFYKASKAFFSLPLEVKRKYEIPGMAGQRGYTSFGKEHAKQSNVGDLKEFYQIGQEVPPGEHARDHCPPNVNVEELPEFSRLGHELYRAFEDSGRQLLRAIALHLNLDETYFDDKMKHGNSILRAIHYPPITEEPKSAIRSEQHEDINLITLLVGASSGGLQVLNMQNAWVEVLPGEDEIVVNVGDMLQRHTNNYLKSTTHRVVNPPKHEWHRPRLSIPFFLHPVSDMDLTCLPSTVTEANPLAYEPITAGEYLDERLAEIGLKK
jgi:isopenicillin N synthase-like dioxygenase